MTGRCQRRSSSGEKFAHVGRVLVHSQPTPEPAAGIVDLGAPLAASDVVVLHAPLVEDTRHPIDARRIATTRPYAANATMGSGSPE